MNVLLIGVGSIGSRHLVNLKELGHKVHAVDTDPDQLRKAGWQLKKTANGQTIRGCLLSALIREITGKDNRHVETIKCIIRSF